MVVAETVVAVAAAKAAAAREVAMVVAKAVVGF